MDMCDTCYSIIPFLETYHALDHYYQWSKVCETCAKKYKWHRLEDDFGKVLIDSPEKTVYWETN
jgi:hypothetical protein